MIYFIQYGNDGPIKIGMVAAESLNAVGSRLMSLQVSTPIKLKLIGCCSGHEEEEKKLHKGFRRHRISGEWFNINKKLINLIEDLSEIDQKDKDLFNETISPDEFILLFQSEFDIDIYFKTLKNLLMHERNAPYYRIFGRRRYKYNECRDYLLNNGFLEKVEEKHGK